MSKTDSLEGLSDDALKKELKRREDERQKAEKKARAEFEAAKEDFVNNTLEVFEKQQVFLTNLKQITILKSNELHEQMFELNDKERPDQKTFSWKNADDTAKVTVERQDRFEFTEEAAVHIHEIKEIFRNKFAKRNKGLYNLLDGLLIKNSKMEYDPKLLAKARKQVRELGDQKLIEAFDKLDECQKVTGTSLYCRVYKRDEHNKWKDVTLQFSAL